MKVGDLVFDVWSSEIGIIVGTVKPVPRPGKLALGREYFSVLFSDGEVVIAVGNDLELISEGRRSCAAQALGL